MLVSAASLLTVSSGTCCIPTASSACRSSDRRCPSGEGIDRCATATRPFLRAHAHALVQGAAIGVSVAMLTSIAAPVLGQTFNKRGVCPLPCGGASGVAVLALGSPASLHCAAFAGEYRLLGFVAIRTTAGNARFVPRHVPAWAGRGVAIPMLSMWFGSPLVAGA